jgi:deoxynucleoside triphosphate triphosphohydrolase SAMHD1
VRRDERRPELKWKHEDMSVQLLEHLIESNYVDMEREDVRLIGDLILGWAWRRCANRGRKRRKSFDKGFIFDIVSNSRNSIDVDKFDYLARDCYNLNMKFTYDPTRCPVRPPPPPHLRRLINFSRVIGDEICFHAKESFNIYSLFHTRYSLHKQVRNDGVPP